MQTEPSPLDLVKALSNANRLRIIGLLSQESAAHSEIAERLKMPLREIVNHLSFLEYVGVIAQTDGKYKLTANGLEKMAHVQLATENQKYVPPENVDEKARKILVGHLNPDGSVRQIPAQTAKLRVILDYLIQAFEPDKDYTEKEVNAVLKRYHSDFASLRRALIDEGLLARDGNGSRYWRTK